MKAECQLIRHFLLHSSSIGGEHRMFNATAALDERESDGVHFLFLLEFIYKEIK